MKVKSSRRVILISGCSSGIGRALAVNLSGQGHTVYAGVRAIESLDAIKSDCLIPVKLDINQSKDVSAVLDFMEGRETRIDILINNAGYGAMGPLIEMPAQELRAQFETNVFSPLAVTQACLPLLQKSDMAQVVNIGSSAGIMPVPFSGAYCASKAAFHTLTEVLRMELHPFGIHCMSVFPGGVSSDFGDNANNKLGDTLKGNSLYKKVVKAIEARAKVSSSSSTTPEMFADELVAALEKRTPVCNKRIGQGSRLMPLMKLLLPTRLREHLLRKMYHLNTLS